MKKLFFRFTSLVVCLIVLASCSACNITGNKDDNSNKKPQDTPSYTITLDENSKDLFVGETQALIVKKIDQNGNIVKINDISYTSDNSSVASIVDGKITANAVGQTYVSVEADGLEASCFVTVKAGKRGQVFEIKLANEVLYKDVPVQAYLYVTQDGVEKGRIENATFTAQDENVLSIDEKGVITALVETESTVINASCVYNGETISVQKTVKVAPPFVYLASDSEVMLASTKTYSGVVNTKFTETYLNIIQLNALTGEKIIVSGDRLTVNENSDVVDNEIIGDKIVFKTAQDKIGSVDVKVLIDESFSVYFTVTVANAIATIADMDKLAFSSYNTPSDLDANYILVNDLDYEGKAIYPIANFVERGAKTMAGYQYKYALNVDDNGVYTAVERENVGEDGYGLTDEQFVSFAKLWSSPKNRAFTGIFDGNGFAIKNGKLMYGANMRGTLESGYSIADISVFGHLQNATIRNVEFNLSLQNPDDYGLNLARIYDNRENDKVIDCTLLKNESGAYRYSAASVAARAYDSTIENVALNIDLSGFSRSSLDGGFVSQGRNMIIRNTAVDMNASITVYAMISAVSQPLGKIENNLVLGVNAIVKDLVEGQSGQNGNWFIRGRDWKTLYNSNKGANASNVVAKNTVIESYVSDIWDMSKFNGVDGGAPKLINGCSVPQI